MQLKAAFLLGAFALNTVVGFACSIGLDIGFKSSHHKEESTVPSVHIHGDGKKHEHHKEAAKQHQEEKKTPKKEKDGCCNDDVLKFQNLDKNLNQNTKTAIDVPALAAILSTILDIDILKASVTGPQLPAVRYLFPPPPNLLISIHRFQI